MFDVSAHTVSSERAERKSSYIAYVVVVVLFTCLYCPRAAYISSYHNYVVLLSACVCLELPEETDTHTVC